MAFTLFSVLISTAQERVSKTIEKSFPLTNSGELELENKYGNITVTGWEQDKVLVKIDVKVNHRRRDNAQDLLGRINPEFKSSSGYVSITSEISNKNTGWFADLFNRTNPIDIDRSRVQIDYEVFLPKKAELKVTNRFGDLVIEGWSGELSTLIEHGNLWLNDDLNKADILLKFGKVRARNLNYASLNLKNGELDMENSKNLRLNSSGTEIQLGSVNTLEIYSNKDDLTITEVGAIYGNLKFSTLNLERLTGGVDLTMKISDFKVTQIKGQETDIAIEQESSDISLTVTDFSHRFNATIEQGVVRLPKSFENVKSDMLDKGRKLRKIEATYGKGKEGTITINGIKGIVTIREKSL
ncbi:hypothetical protein [Flagellimonas allohymeniacidonis]|uniref:Adhesin domain-containing protein n=1 Tax=Flagellimonas allohymeniacidonis TaxID=2517819 RepID=A0A4Q8QE95_9FLAO|nr:hypothetical protein [Allomuricauda hymeniacidonis]TAI48751.1 hypothetical protein EW142_02825 [Allomuricauda hymeniacidonis]